MIFDFTSKIILKYRNYILCALILLSSYFAYYAYFSPHSLKVDFSLDQLFPEKDVELDLYKRFISEFGKEDDTVIGVYKTQDLLSKDNIKILNLLTNDLESLNGVEFVLSLSNIEDEYGYMFDLDKSDTEWIQAAKNLKKNPLYSNMFISLNNKFALVLVNLEDDISDQSKRNQIINQIYDITNNYYDEWSFAGIPVLRAKYIEFVNYERMVFLPLSILVALLILYLLFRQIKYVIFPLIAILVNLIWISFFMSYLNISINMVSYLTFNLLMIIGTSNSIHIMMKYFEILKNKYDKKDALLITIKEIGSALFLTSVTTATGFFALLFADIRITKEFGFIVGIGVLLMFVQTLIIIPILFSFTNIPSREYIHKITSGLQLKSASFFESINKNYKSFVILLSIFIFFVSAFFITRIDTNLSLLDDLKPGNDLYDDLVHVEKHFGGTFPLEIIIDTKEEDGIFRNKFLNNVDSFQDSIKLLNHISYSRSLVDLIKFKNNEWNETGYKIPDNGLESKSFVLENPILSKYTDKSFSKFRISARMHNITSNDSKKIKSDLKVYFKKVFNNNFEISITGSPLLALKTNLKMVSSLSYSFLLAFLVIFISINILFKSTKLSLISIIPNVLPLLIAAGIMGLFGIKLRPSTAMTFSIALGIAVDNSIHFLSRFKQVFSKTSSYSESINHALNTTGKSIISTNITLALGFFVLIYSNFVPNQEFSILATIVLISAMFSSLIILPVLIKIFKPKISN